MPLKLLMMGTGRFALPALLSLYKSNHMVGGLITQPDRTGHGHHHHKNPLKEAAQERRTPILQPENVNSNASLSALRRLNADLLVVVAYGQILSEQLLQIPRLGAINVHGSLLPKYRGAAPVQYAILNGDNVTGISVLLIEPELDAGPVLGAQQTQIGPKETAGELEHRLSLIAAPLMIRVIDGLEAGTITPLVQDPHKVSKASRMKKSDGTIDWTKSAEKVSWHVRAMQPWPKAFTFLHQTGKPPVRLILLDVEPHSQRDDARSGRIVLTDNGQLLVCASDRAVRILRLQPEGKRPMSADDFLKGHTIVNGDWMGTESCND